jgi:hypothetical protein
VLGAGGTELRERRQPGHLYGRVTSDVDSLNPFLGVEDSYEMWALTYDCMVGYSMKDMSPARPGDQGRPLTTG